MKDWILEHTWIAWVPAMIPCAIGAAWFAWYAVELESVTAWLQSAGYVSGLLAWGAAMWHARGADKRVELWRETAESWEHTARACQAISDKRGALLVQQDLLIEGQRLEIEMLQRPQSPRRWVQ